MEVKELQKLKNKAMKKLVKMDAIAQGELERRGFATSDDVGGYYLCLPCGKTSADLYRTIIKIYDEYKK